MLCKNRIYTRFLCDYQRLFEIRRSFEWGEFFRYVHLNITVLLYHMMDYPRFEQFLYFGAFDNDAIVFAIQTTIRFLLHQFF